MTFVLAVIALMWVVGAAIALRGMSRMPRIMEFPPCPDPECPSVSILVAARDEADSVREALRSLLAQDYPCFEVVVVNDRSTDATQQILDDFARQHGNLRVINLSELPPGWLGKPHALTVGYTHASGEWLVFTDADVRFAPDLLCRAVGLVKATGWDHLSCMWRSELEGFWEKTLFTFWFFSTFMWLHPWSVSDLRSRRYFGSGVFQLMRRSTYEAIGTHQRLAMEVFDDVKLGKLVKQGGFRSGVGLGTEGLQIRWHRGLHGMVHGLAKNAFATLDYSLMKLTLNLLFSISLFIVPFLAMLLASGPAQMMAAVSVIAVFVLMVYAARLCRVSPWYALAYPLAAAALWYIVLRSAMLTLRQGGVVWRDSFYPLEELRKGMV